MNNQRHKVTTKTQCENDQANFGGLLWFCCSSLLLLTTTAAATQGQAVQSGAVYRVRNQCSSKVLDVSGNSTADGALVHQWAQHDRGNQQWKVEATDSGYYRLVAQHSQKSLDVQSSQTANGTQVWQYTSNNTAAQQWKITTSSDGYSRVESRLASNKVLDVNEGSAADGAKVQLWTSNNGCAQRWKFEQVGGSTGTSTTPTAELKATAFVHGDYNGTSQQFGVGTHRADQGQLNTIGNDQISSLRVPAGLQVRVCDNSDGSGACATFSGDAAYVGDQLNDRASFIEVTSSLKATAFVHGDYNGTSQQFGVGTHRADQGQLNTIGNDQISSLRVPAGLQVRVCDNSDGSGACATFSGDAAYVGDQLNDRASFIEVTVGSSLDTSGTGVQARMADKFVDTIGVNTHVWYNWDDAKADLNELGIRHIRINKGDHEMYKQICEQLGVKFSTIADPDEGSGQEQVDWVKAVGVGCFSIVEGMNEPDLFERDVEGGWANKARNFQRDLYAAFKNDPATRNIPIAGPSIWENHGLAGDLSAWADYANIHTYPGGRNPEAPWGYGPDDYASLEWWKRHNLSHNNLHNKPIVSTETGYHNALEMGSGGHRPAPEDVQAAYETRMYFWYFNSNIVRTYKYELQDEFGYNLSDPEHNFGWVRHDRSRKPAFYAIRNVISLLKDPGASFQPGKLDYSVQGDTTDVQTTLLQKRTGEFYLAVWLARHDIWDVERKVMLSEPNRSVTVRINTPLSSAARVVPNNSDQWENVAVSNGQLNLQLGSKLVLLKLTPR